MEKLKQKAKALAEAAAEKARAEVKAALADDLPPHLAITETGEGVTVTGRDLHQEMIEQSSLRDVAFLMRCVR
ncbi:hypothetical protein [Parasphingorhabdus sp.]|uniref:hypothetical protein n=1 Tax=Parasphingorhabdus sp. TaxID=2709688 RepID=UPI002F921F37